LGRNGGARYREQPRRRKQSGLGLAELIALEPLHSPPPVSEAFLIGVDLSPNLSVTGSLAAILWPVALRREGLHISAKEFLRAGVVAMPPALVLAIGALLLAS
jgi:arsenical pump membrane protein